MSCTRFKNYVSRVIQLSLSRRRLKQHGRVIDRVSFLGLNYAHNVVDENETQNYANLVQTYNICPCFLQLLDDSISPLFPGGYGSGRVNEPETDPVIQCDIVSQNSLKGITERYRISPSQHGLRNGGT